MFAELANDQWKTAQPILAQFSHHLEVQSLLCGNTHGRIWVDKTDQPTTVLVWTGHRILLAGKPDDIHVSSALSNLFTDTIYPQAIKAGKEMFTFFFEPAEWLAQIDVILPEKYPIHSDRQYYEISTTTPPVGDWRKMLPTGFNLHPVDTGLLSRTNLLRLDDLRTEMCSERESLDEFFAHSFGVCLENEGELAGWCLSEYNCAYRCEIGIETTESYRRRGLATAMTLALVEQAWSRGYSHVGWHCRANNAPSAATALRAGLTKMCDYPAYIAFFDPADNLAVNGNTAWFQGRSEEALHWYKRAFASGEAKGWAYWYAAGCAATSYQPALAIHYLTQALDRGYTVTVEALAQNPWFTELRGLPTWKLIAERLA
jgi:GNAT superfamily N-acetyltransferase